MSALIVAVVTTVAALVLRPFALRLVDYLHRRWRARFAARWKRDFDEEYTFEPTPLAPQRTIPTRDEVQREHERLLKQQREACHDSRCSARRTLGHRCHDLDCKQHAKVSR
jgi:hypothetical protein